MKFTPTTMIADIAMLEFLGPFYTELEKRFPQFVWLAVTRVDDLEYEGVHIIRIKNYRADVSFEFSELKRLIVDYLQDDQQPEITIAYHDDILTIIVPYWA